MSAPRAILGGLDELRQRVNAGHHHYAIMLAGGNALSRKTIRLRQRLWSVDNGIDDSQQRQLTDGDLWTESNIGEALDKGALIDMAGDDGLIKVADKGIVDAEAFVAEARAKAPRWTPTGDPLTYKLNGGPGAIRMGVTTRAEWGPADAELLLERMEIGPATVAQIDLSAISMGPGRKAATTSIELTIEDIDDLVATLKAIKADAIEHRRFTLNAEGFWTNGRENE